MRIITPHVAAVFVTTLLLTGCATHPSPTQTASQWINRESITPTTHDAYPAKKPQSVSVYTNDHLPHAAYRVIGIAKVSTYNVLGMQRQTEVLHSMMKTLAASIGGDGLIDMHHTNETVQAKVIAYQKILI